MNIHILAYFATSGDEISNESFDDPVEAILYAMKNFRHNFYWTIDIGDFTDISGEGNVKDLVNELLNLYSGQFERDLIEAAKEDFLQRQDFINSKLP